MTDAVPRLTYLISSLEMGGAERGMARFADALVEEYDVTVVALRGGDKTVVQDLPGAARVVDLGIENPSDVGALGRLWREIGDTDVLVCSLYHAAVLGTVLGRLRRVPTIVTWQHNEAFQNPLRRALFGVAARASDRTLADSESVAAMVAETFSLPEGAVRTVPIAGVDTDGFAPEDDEPGTSGDEETVVGILGTLTEQKNHDAVLATAARLREESIRFEVAGDGPRRESLEARAEDRDLDISFRGFVEDVPAFLNGLDVYVQPSHHEGLCITAIEAMACGLPVVATAVGGLTESVVDGETGYLVAPGDLDAFVDRIRTLHESPELRARMSRRGRERAVDHYSRAVLVREFRAALADARRSGKR